MPVASINNCTNTRPVSEHISLENTALDVCASVCGQNTACESIVYDQTSNTCVLVGVPRTGKITCAKAAAAVVSSRWVVVVATLLVSVTAWYAVLCHQKSVAKSPKK